MTVFCKDLNILVLTLNFGQMIRDTYEIYLWDTFLMRKNPNTFCGVAKDHFLFCGNIKAGLPARGVSYLLTLLFL